MKEGKFSSGIKINDPNTKLSISKTTSSFEIFVSNPKANHKNVYMKEPTIVYNEEDLTLIFKGQLAKGGLLTSSPQSLSIIFGCSPLNKSNTDIQFTLHFDNNSFINMFFNKECNTVEEIQEYFTFLYVIYWILILLIIGFLVVLFFYYLKKNELSLYEFYDKIREYVIRKVDDYKRRRNQESESKHLVDSKYAEEDDIDVKISSLNTGINEQERNNKNINIEYGGI
jgi:hypothetical protein